MHKMSLIGMRIGISLSLYSLRPMHFIRIG
jgi:hypothetical protein